LGPYLGPSLNLLMIPVLLGPVFASLSRAVTHLRSHKSPLCLFLCPPTIGHFPGTKGTTLIEDADGLGAGSQREGEVYRVNLGRPWAHHFPIGLQNGASIPCTVGPREIRCVFFGN
jgi:hypothetical protein